MEDYVLPFEPPLIDLSAQPRSKHKPRSRAVEVGVQPTSLFLSKGHINRYKREYRWQTTRKRQLETIKRNRRRRNRRGWSSDDSAS